MMVYGFSGLGFWVLGVWGSGFRTSCLGTRLLRDLVGL